MKYVRFKNVKMSNFLSVGKVPVEINFKPGINVITGCNYDKVDRANGVGKSTITDAIHFALYGDTIRELKKENIVNDQAPDAKCIVELEFTCVFGDETKECKVIRSINPAKCYFYVNNEDMTRSGMPQTTELIVETIKTTSGVFQNSVVMSINSTVPFMAQKKIEKRKFIEGILGLEVFSNMLTLARNDYNETKKILDIETAKFDVILRQLQTLEAQKTVYDATKKKKIDELTSRANSNKRELETLVNSLKKLGTVDEQMIKDATEGHTRIVTELSELNNELSILQLKFWTADNQIEALEKESESAPIKPDAKETKAAATKIQELESAALALGNIDPESRKETETTIEALKQASDKLATKARGYQSTIVESKGHIKVCESALKTLSKPDQKCPHCGKNIEEAGVAHYEKAKKGYEDDIAKHQGALVSALNHYDAVNAKITDVELELKKLVEGNKQSLENALTHSKLQQEIQTQKRILTKYEEDVKRYDQAVEQYQKKLAQSKTSLAEHQETKKSVGPKIERVKEKIQIDTQTERVLNNRINDLRITRKEIESLQQRKVTITFYIKDIDKDIEQLNSETEIYQRDIDNTKSQVADARAEIETLQIRLEIIESAKFITSEEGVKSYIVKKILNVLNNRLAFYLKKLESNCIVKFDEYFEESITNERGKSCSYFNFSGAERKAIDLSMLFTFQDVRRAQADVGINMSMFDELLDSSLDEKGIELVLDILKERVDMYNEAVYIISHRKECRKYCTSGEIIFLEKRNGITTRASNYDIS